MLDIEPDALLSAGGDGPVLAPVIPAFFRLWGISLLDARIHVITRRDDPQADYDSLVLAEQELHHSAQAYRN